MRNFVNYSTTTVVVPLGVSHRQKAGKIGSECYRYKHALDMISSVVMNVWGSMPYRYVADWFDPLVPRQATLKRVDAVCMPELQKFPRDVN